MRDYSQPVSYQKHTHASRAALPKKQYDPLDWSRVDVVASIERYTSTRLGSEGNTQLVGACPFDDCVGDGNGFIVWPGGSNRSTERNMIHYLCRNCPQDRRSGDLIKLLRLLYPDWTFRETQINIGMIDEGDDSTPAKPIAIDRQRQADEERRKQLLEQLELLETYYPDMQKALLTLDRPKQYLASRGISLEDAARYGLGYFPLREETRHKIDNRLINAWFGRVVFPLSDQGKRVTFAGRTLRLWQPGMTPDQHKEVLEANGIRRVLKTSPCGYFGYREAIQHPFIVAAEGEIDALSLMIAGIEGVVAMGTTLSARLIPLSVERVTLALDTDLPGKEAAKRLCLDLADNGIEVNSVVPLSGKDWNDTLVMNGIAAITEAFTPEPTTESPAQDVSLVIEDQPLEIYYHEEYQPTYISNDGIERQYIVTYLSYDPIPDMDTSPYAHRLKREIEGFHADSGLLEFELWDETKNLMIAKFKKWRLWDLRQPEATYRPAARGVQATPVHQGCTCNQCNECATREQLLAYGSEHGWPRLLIRPWLAIPSGESHWRGYAAKHSQGDLQTALASARPCPKLPCSTEKRMVDEKNSIETATTR